MARYVYITSSEPFIEQSLPYYVPLLQCFISRS